MNKTYIAKIDNGTFSLDMNVAHKAYKEASLIKARWNTLQVGEVTSKGVVWGKIIENEDVHTRTKSTCQNGMCKKAFDIVCALAIVFTLAMLISQGIK